MDLKVKSKQKKLDKVLHRLQYRWSTTSIYSKHSYFQRIFYEASEYILSDVADDIIIDESERRTDLDWT